MFNKEFRKFRFIEVIEADTAGELRTLLSQIYLPCELITIYPENGKHYAWVNFKRPLKRPEIVKKSPRNTDKEYKES